MKSFTQWLKLRLSWSFQRLLNTQSFFFKLTTLGRLYIKLYGQIVDFVFFFIFRKHLRRKTAAARTILQWMDIRGALWHVTAPPTPWPSTECWYPTDKRNFIKRAIEILKTFFPQSVITMKRRNINSLISNFWKFCFLKDTWGKLKNILFL